MFKKIIKIGTRESRLARLQTDLAIYRLKEIVPDLEIEIQPIKAIGDKVLDKSIVDVGVRGVFVKELEESLLSEQVDLVVHSLKDLPTSLPDGLSLASVFNRAIPFDALVSPNGMTLSQLPPGSKIATSSRRRAAQLLSIRPDFEFVDVRGNIETRLSKLDNGLADAMVLAAAGLVRLNLDHRISDILSENICTPAVGQGALAIECRTADSEILKLTKLIEDRAASFEVLAERTFLDALGGGCTVPIGALCQSKDDLLTMFVCVSSLDGKQILRAQDSDTDPVLLGKRLVQTVLNDGAERILAELRNSAPNIVSAP